MISTHVLDLTRGVAAAGVAVTLSRVTPEDHDAPERVARLTSAVTDADGRVKELLQPGEALQAGVYELTFETGRYFAGAGMAHFHPRVSVRFEVTEPGRHHHVPLLVSPFGYSTYRGT